MKRILSPLISNLMNNSRDASCRKMRGRTHPLHENWKVSVKGHPGSTADEIENEPEWEDSGDEHHIGFKNRQGRRPGFTHTGDEGEHHEEVEEALRVFHESKKEVQEKGHLVNFRDAFKNEKVAKQLKRSN